MVPAPWKERRRAGVCGAGALGCGLPSLADSLTECGSPREAWGWAGCPDCEQKLLPGLQPDVVRREDAGMHGPGNQATRATAGRASWGESQDTQLRAGAWGVGTQSSETSIQGREPVTV